MANDGGPMFPDPAPAEDGRPGISVRDGFAMAIVASEERGRLCVQADEAREVYDYAQLLTNEKLRRDEADRDEGKPE